MRILHILSQKELTGAEVYAIQLGEWSISQGNQVFIVSDQLHKKTKIPFSPRPVHAPTFSEKIENFFWLRKFLAEKEIDVIHCHSRSALRMAHWARRGLPVALISTVHGEQHYSFSKRLFDIYGEKIIAVCENLKKHLISDFKMPSAKIKTIRNPIAKDYPSISFETTAMQNISATAGQKRSLRILVVGRTSGPKGKRAAELLRHVVPQTLKKYPQLKWEFVGGPVQNLDVGSQGFLRYLQQIFRDRVLFQAKVENIFDYYKDADLVIGAGRVAFEATLAGKTVLCIGESGSHGILTPENVNTALESNFGDIGEVPMDFEEINLEIDSYLQNPHFYHQRQDILKNMIANETDMEIVGAQVQEEYKSAIFKRRVPGWIPILMYHKIVPTELDTPHRTFVTTTKFDRQCWTLEKLGLQAITFSELHHFREGQLPWTKFPRRPVIITFDDGYKNNVVEALPVLKKHQLKATFFLLSDQSVVNNYWDQKDEKELLPLMNSEDRQKLVEAGMEIGSHGIRHDKVIYKSENEVYQEWAESKEHLETEFKQEVVALAYPFGDSNKMLSQMAAMAHYQYAVNTDQGGMEIEDDRYQIFRVNVFPEDGPLQIWKKTRKWYRKYYFNKRNR